MGIRIGHVAITVRDLEKALNFYSSVFGFKQVAEWTRPEPQIHGVIIEDENGVGLELIVPDHHTYTLANPKRFEEAGLKHIAFQTDDAEKLFAKAVEHGAKVHWPLREGVSVKQMGYVIDLDGVVVEIYEPR